MAGVNAEGGMRTASFHAGPLSRLARAQYAALMEMRWLVMTNGLRSLQGIFELGSRGVGFLFYGAMGLGVSFALGFAGTFFAGHGDWKMVSLIFWALLVLWQTVPIGLASFQTQFEMGSLLRFPVSFSSFYVLNLTFGLVDISTILGGLSSLGLWAGITMARPDLRLWTLAVVLLFGIFNILLVRMILLWLDKWLSRRRTRELVGALIVSLLLSVQLLNPALRPERHVQEATLARQPAMTPPLSGEIDILEKTQYWLPPGLAATTLRDAAHAQTESAAIALGGLCLYVLCAAGLLAMRLRAEFRGESLGEVESERPNQGREGGLLFHGAGPLAAVMEKELHTMVRSMPLLYAMGAPVFMVIVVSNLFWNNAPGEWRTTGFALPGCLAYALMGISQLIYNTLGSDGTGVRLIFISSTPVRTVMLAKNMFHALAFGVVACVAWVLTSLRVGWPDEIMAAVTVSWLVFSLAANLTIGNVFSLVMPHRVHLGKLTRQRGSASSSLLSMFVQLILLGAGAAIFLLCSKAGRLWLAVPVFLSLAAVASYAWFRVYGHLDVLATRRKDLLVYTLAKTE